jgi:hypothetical protein
VIEMNLTPFLERSFPFFGLTAVPTYLPYVPASPARTPLYNSIRQKFDIFVLLKLRVSPYYPRFDGFPHTKKE